ncbi:MAG: DUF2110 family protein, partial [Haloplanus sp.]
MVVLATKCYVEGSARERALDGMDALVGNAVGDLDVTWEIGVRHDDFVSVTVTGEDEVAARNVLREAWGEVSTGTGLTADETYVGTLESWDEDGFVLDAGERVRIPADQLGLGPGSPSQVRDRFGLVQHLPLRFVAGDPPRLADEERDRLFGWTRSDNGRLNVNSATRGEVRATINR